MIREQKWSNPRGIGAPDSRKIDYFPGRGNRPSTVLRLGGLSRHAANSGPDFQSSSSSHFAEIRTDTNNVAWSASPSTSGTSKRGVQRQARRLSEGERLKASLLPSALCAYSRPSTRLSLNPERIQEKCVKHKLCSRSILDTMRQSSAAWNGEKRLQAKGGVRRSTRFWTTTARLSSRL